MQNPMKRWTALLMAVVLMASILIMPAAAAEDAETETAQAEVEKTLEEFLNPLPVEEVEPEAPLVNIIDPDGIVLPEDEEVSDEPETEEDASVDGETSEETEEELSASEGPGEETVDSEQTADSLLTPSDESQEFTVSYYDGGTLLLEETVSAGGTPAAVPAENSEKEAISGWLSEAGSFVFPADAVITADTAYYAWYAPVLEMEAHNRYINGYGDGMFGPEYYMTRAQAATILYNLMVSKEKGPYEASFSDVSEGAWYYDAVMTLASYKVISGYPDGTFGPDWSVSRAEFVTMLVRIFGTEEGDVSFSDVPADSWAAPYVYAAAAKGWVQGYGDGTFCPYNGITRAEAVVVVNRVLHRVCDKNAVDSGENILRYLDVSENAWYYYDVMEASIAHSYTNTSGSEIWTDYAQENSGLEPGLQTVDGVMYYISSTTRQPVAVKAGLNEIEGGYYYAAQDGVVIDVALDTSALTEGFNMIPGYNALFYWDGADKGARYLTKGLNKIGDYTYYANEDGYLLNNTFFGGVVELDGKLYIAGDYCNIITTWYDYSSGKAVEKDLAETTYEYNQNMYYVREDYSLARDEWVGYLYFDANGKYTTGDATLDAYVYNIVKDVIANNALTPEQKLLKIYYHFRGGSGATLGQSGYGYASYGDGYTRMRYNQQAHLGWLQNCAKVFFSTKRGSCYYWAGAYLYCARRLGFQSYVAVGNLEKDRAPSDPARHCWCMIYWNGKWHISDVETEWGYLNRYYIPGTSLYYNLFKQALPRENVTYYENPERPAICYFFKDES